jgi:hypothetical protein
MATGCLQLIASAIFLCVGVLASVLFIYFAPPSAVFGFLFGTGLIGLMYLLVHHFPALLAVSGARSAQSRTIGAMTQEAIRLSSDPRATGITFVKVLCWILIAVMAGLALLFGAFAVALTSRGELTSGLTGAGVASGYCTALIFVLWTIIQKVGEP